MLSKYLTPAGFSDIVIEIKGEYLTGLRFEKPGDDPHSVPGSVPDAKDFDIPVLRETVEWLDGYFAGNPPDKLPDMRLDGMTPFREKVLREVGEIPYGCTLTYGDIARAIDDAEGTVKVSSRAVGGAVRWNPVCIIIPCHRVVGKGGKLTGYSGGIENKIRLLEHERDTR